MKVKARKKSRKTPIIIGVCAVLLLAAGGAYYASQNAAQKKRYLSKRASRQASCQLWLNLIRIMMSIIWIRIIQY
ncbi:hypothetical protein [Lactococcus fujiensis]|uniref:hypothetical protein n=1 Tax=Lactococcus fujiensis TaxID=610251 RepID=UPI002093521A|nr:hypothetical protein [Lactococcus fujiensis]